MMELIKINGIRLSKNFLRKVQENHAKQPLYQTLASSKINMVFMTMNTLEKISSVSGIIASNYINQQSPTLQARGDHQNVCMISLYPHGSRLNLLAFLMTLIGNKKIYFKHMSSSGAMLTFIIDAHMCDTFVELLSTHFDLPDSHVPFEQDENEEQTEFLKRKYPEARATYEEKKIKTYGISHTPALILNSYLFSFDQLAEFGKKVQNSAEKESTFIHTSAYMESNKNIRLFLVTKKVPNIPASKTYRVDLLSFQGPHFGDRHSIASRALNCLSEKAIPVLQADCTGASIHIIFPLGKGKRAQNALRDVFETP